MATQNLGTMSSSVLQDYHTKRHTSGIELAAIDAALAQLKDSGSRTNWLLACYDPGNKHRLLLLRTGEGGFEELLGSLDDACVLYGCFVFSAANQIKRAPATPPRPRRATPRPRRRTAAPPRHAATPRRASPTQRHAQLQSPAPWCARPALALALALTLTLARCAFVSWVGPEVSGMERARVSMHRSDVQNHVRPVVSFDLQEREEVDVQCEAVRRSIAAQLGASVLSYDGQVRYLAVTLS